MSITSRVHSFEISLVCEQNWNEVFFDYIPRAKRSKNISCLGVIFSYHTLEVFDGIYANSSSFNAFIIN